MKPIKLTKEDMHNLYDLCMMVDNKTFDTFVLNKMDKWFLDFKNRLEVEVIPELHHTNCPLKKGVRDERRRL